MAMVGKKLVLVVLLAMAAICAGKEYEVEWNIPVAENTYSAFQKHTYHVGDTLKFTYMEEMHNVVKVGSEDEYTQCMTKAPAPMFTDGHTSMKLNEPGDHFFICTIANHCARGMKLKVQAVHHQKHHG